MNRRKLNGGPADGTVEEVELKYILKFISFQFVQNGLDFLAVYQFKGIENKDEPEKKLEVYEYLKTHPHDDAIKFMQERQELIPRS